MKFCLAAPTRQSGYATGDQVFVPVLFAYASAGFLVPTRLMYEFSILASNPQKKNTSYSVIPSPYINYTSIPNKAYEIIQYYQMRR